MAEEVSEKATDKLEEADYQHVDFESVSVVIDGILDGVVKTVITGLRETEDNEGS